MGEPAVHEGRCGLLEWTVCATAYPGQRRSGDAFLVQATAAGALIAVVDGLGHGEEAADVADRALASLRETAGQSLVRFFTACHEELRGSRGVVMTLAEIDAGRGSLAWVAVGNVDASVMRPGRNGGTGQRWSVPMRGGVVGERLPSVRESTVPLAAGDTFIAATDGVSPAFADGVDLTLGSRALAASLHAAYARADDDALVLVARLVTARAPLTPDGPALSARPSR